MTLTSEAYLEIIDDDGTTAVFRFESFEPTTTLNKNFLVGAGGGQLISELADFVPSVDSENSSGYVVDVGLGAKRFEYLVEVTPDSSGPWGIVSDNDVPLVGGSGTQLSAHDGDPLTKAEVLSEWVRNVLVDSVSSSGDAHLYKGNWTTGRFADSAGAFDQPIPVAPESVEIRRNPDEPSRVELTIEMVRFETFDVDIDFSLPELIP